VPRIEVFERLARGERWAGHGVEGGGRGVAAAKGASGKVAPLVDRTRRLGEASRGLQVNEVPGGCVANFAGGTVHAANRAAAKAAEMRRSSFETSGDCPDSAQAAGAGHRPKVGRDCPPLSDGFETASNPQA
jgi:hypothetical protein